MKEGLLYEIQSQHIYMACKAFSLWKVNFQQLEFPTTPIPRNQNTLQEIEMKE